MTRAGDRRSEIRAERLMRYDKRQPDGGIFEILVALAYRRRGWTTVEFIPERPGVSAPPIFTSRDHALAGRWSASA